MAFTLAALGRVNANNNLSVTIDYSNMATPRPFGSSNMWTYNGIVAGDTQAQIAAPGYFTTAPGDPQNTLAIEFQRGDSIQVCDNANAFQTYLVTNVVYPFTDRPGVITIQAAFTNIPLLQVTAFDAVRFQQIYANPLVVVPTPPAGFINIVDQAIMTFGLITNGGFNPGSGGDVGLQYGVAPHLAGTLASQEIISTAFLAPTQAAAYFMTQRNSDTDCFLVNCSGFPISLSNTTAPFTGGTFGQNFFMRVWYRIIPDGI